MKRFPEHQLNAKIRRTRDVTALSRLALLLFCGLVLAGGFVFAAKQHFAAVQYGYRKRKLAHRAQATDWKRISDSLSKKNALSRLTNSSPPLGVSGLKPARPGQIGNKPQIHTDKH